MKTIELATLAAVSGGTALNTAAASSWSRPAQNWWNQAAPKWNAPAPAPTQPLGPFVPDQSKQRWA